MSPRTIHDLQAARDLLRSGRAHDALEALDEVLREQQGHAGADAETGATRSDVAALDEAVMSRVPMRAAMALRRRPRRARWSPWRRTLILQWTVGLSCAAVVLITIARGIVR